MEFIGGVYLCPDHSSPWTLDHATWSSIVSVDTPEDFELPVPSRQASDEKFEFDSAANLTLNALFFLGPNGTARILRLDTGGVTTHRIPELDKEYALVTSPGEILIQQAHGYHTRYVMSRSLDLSPVLAAKSVKGPDVPYHGVWFAPGGVSIHDDLESESCVVRVDPAEAPAWSSQMSCIPDHAFPFGTKVFLLSSDALHSLDVSTREQRVHAKPPVDLTDAVLGFTSSANLAKSIVIESWAVDRCKTW